MTDEPRECNIQTTGGELEVNKSQRIIILLKENNIPKMNTDLNMYVDVILELQLMTKRSKNFEKLKN